MKKNKSKQKAVEVDDTSELDAILDGLVLSEDRLFDSALNQPVLFAKVAKMRIDAMRQRMKLEGRLKTRKADLSLQIREFAEQKGEKLTEKGIEARVDSDVADIAEAHREAIAMEEYLDLLVQAYRARANSIRVIADLKQADVYHGQKVAGASELENVRENLKQKFPGKKQ